MAIFWDIQNFSDEFVKFDRKLNKIAEPIHAIAANRRFHLSFAWRHQHGGFLE